jgi:glycosyltransferase involved in cell wall biosynthesis
VVVGDGPLRSLLPQAVGFVPPRELGPWYERAALLVVPSRREGYGMAAREAMAHGRPVVATAVGGLVDAVEDGVTGLLVRPGDVPGLRHAVERLLADARLRTTLGAAARARAESEWSTGTFGERLREVLQETVSRYGSGRASGAREGRRAR